MMGKRIFLSVVFGFVLLHVSPSEARRLPTSESDLFEKIRENVRKNDLKDVRSLIEKELSKNPNAEMKDLLKFELGYVYFQLEQYDKSVTTFQEFLEMKSRLEDYGHYYLAQNYLKLGKEKEAQDALKKVETMSPNLKLRNESQLDLAILSLKNKSFKDARGRLVSLEKKARGTDRYPEVVYQLALAEKGSFNQAKSCFWLRRLYVKYPTFDRVAEWGADLAENKVAGEKTECRADIEDFRSRVKNLMWSGLIEKAQSEINVVKSRVAKENQYQADELQAQFYLQEGEPKKALDILKPYYETYKTNFGYLMLLASASARSGEVHAAVGSYYEGYKLSPKSKSGRQALYQSAFLSYQFQDYDGAGRRFREFLKAYPRTGLTRDAQWNLAWLQYLKGDFKGAYHSLSRLSEQRTSRKRKASEDRIDYWKAMSLFRLGKVDQAKGILEKLSKDRLLGYYAITSQARLKKIASLKPAEIPAAEPPTPMEPPKKITRFSWNEFLIASPVGSNVNFASDETEYEENVAVNQESNEEEEEGEEATTDAVNETGRSEVIGAQPTSEIKTPGLAQRFEKARDLMIVGLEDWAKWDLYEIERSTKNKDYLRTLMNEYTTVGHFHRSSYIGQSVFSPARAANGIDGVRYLWEFAYPQAYQANVESAAKEFKIPQELIWGIMKAESQYKKDAISPVGALGLMQVMPFTGKKIAQMLGDYNFRASQLLEPKTAIRIGGRYLARLMQKFDQAIPFVAASYNAGPHRVNTWLAHFGGLEMDEFIEHIPFVETRNYVKKVVSNSFVYAKLYGQNKELPLNLSDPIKLKVDQSVFSKENWDEI